jgi:hypothetical protein
VTRSDGVSCNAVGAPRAPEARGAAKAVYSTLGLSEARLPATVPARCVWGGHGAQPQQACIYTASIPYRPIGWRVRRHPPNPKSAGVTLVCGVVGDENLVTCMPSLFAVQ